MYGILKANFLVSRDAIKNWRFIVYCTVLAIVMIASSHSAERKVHRIAKLNTEVKELRSEHIERRSDLMKLKMESSITSRMKGRGIGPSDTPPNKVRVVIKE